MAVNNEQMMTRYIEVYQSLYRRTPSELRSLGGEWVIVNGARMTLNELQMLTEQLQRELNQEKARKRTLLQKLVSWLKN